MYSDQQWRTEPSARLLRKENRPHLLPAAVHSGNCFRISNLRSPSANRYTIWPARSLSRMLFTPRDVRYLEAATELPTIDGLGILRAEDAVPGAPYSVYTDDAIDRDSVPPPSDRMRAMLTPPDWALNDPEIQQLASDLFEGKPETRHKIGAVINHFRTNGKYSLEVTVPDGLSEDSVQWFLKENPAAHCEFFATGTVVLLRMAGVHCRYVTGFLITDRTPTAVAGRRGTGTLMRGSRPGTAARGSSSKRLPPTAYQPRLELAPGSRCRNTCSDDWSEFELSGNSAASGSLATW